MELHGNYRPTGANRSTSSFKLTSCGCLFVFRIFWVTFSRAFRRTLIKHHILAGKAGSRRKRKRLVGSSDSEGRWDSMSDKSAFWEAGLRRCMRKDGSERGSNWHVFLLFRPPSPPPCAPLCHRLPLRSASFTTAADTPS